MAITMNVGDSVTMTAIAKDQNGAQMSAQLTWTSSDATIVTVTASDDSLSAMVNGLAAGNATVTIVGGNVTQVVSVSVQAQVLTTLNIFVDDVNVIDVAPVQDSTAPAPTAPALPSN